MKKKTNLFSLLLMTGLAVILTYSCSKSNDSNNPTSDGGTVTDIDGNVYHTVTIGTQVWMVENLKTTKYSNGDPITNVTSGATWAALTTGAYCWYDNDPATYKATYGALYNWFVVADNRKIAPVGWHVPTDPEWTTLIMFLGGNSVAGGKLKETSNMHWLNLNAGATNSSSFTALPGGVRLCYLGNYADIGNEGHWWSSTDIDADQALSRNLVDKYAWVGDGGGYYSKRFGFSVRCVRD